MTAGMGIPRVAHPRQLRGERLKDEVYRQMFRLEEGYPGAEMGLALVLLRAWLAADSRQASDEERNWLKKVSPICVEMNEAILQAGGAARTCVQ
jgi:hypothetical protein